MSFISILQKVGMIAGHAVPQLISITNPPLGAIVGSVLNSIMLAEANIGPGQGGIDPGAGGIDRGWGGIDPGRGGIDPASAA